MLTNEALHERKWGRYPSLGRLLGEHPVPSHYYGFSSISDDLFSWLNRAAEVAVTVREHADSLRAVTDAELAPRLPDDLGRLERELHEASRFFTEHEELVRDLCREAHEQEHRRRQLTDAALKKQASER
jgi:hypothetical protein